MAIYSSTPLTIAIFMIFVCTVYNHYVMFQAMEIVRGSTYDTRVTILPLQLVVIYLTYVYIVQPGMKGDK